MTPRIVALGEILWDLLPTGAVLGGAPANFAFHARSLGAETTLISRVGDDEAGQEILRRLGLAGIPGDTVQIDAERPTGTVSVELSADGQPSYVIHEGVAWDAIAADDTSLAACRKANAVCFGTLAQRAADSRRTIQNLVAAASTTALRIFDLNLRQSFFSKALIEASLQLANVLKLNDTELVELAKLFGLPGSEEVQMRTLAERFELRVVALTRGAEGSILLAGGELVEGRGPVVTVRDTIGAGDSFTAALAHGILAGWPLGKTNRLANEVAAFVCSQSGATPVLPEWLLQEFRTGTA